jgi:hypothetical protein
MNFDRPGHRKTFTALPYLYYDESSEGDSENYMINIFDGNDSQPNVNRSMDSKDARSLSKGSTFKRNKPFILNESSSSDDDLIHK